jgi:hypothetical protein
MNKIAGKEIKDDFFEINIQNGEGAFWTSYINLNNIKMYTLTNSQTSYGDGISINIQYFDDEEVRIFHFEKMDEARETFDRLCKRMEQRKIRR